MKMDQKQSVSLTIPGKRRRQDEKNKIIASIYNCRGLYLFLVPVIIYFFIYAYMPLYGVQLAFKQFNPVKGIFGSHWIGFDNFTRFFNSYYFWRLIRNTVGLNLYGMIVSFPFPIILALLFNEISSQKLKKTVQTIAYAPNFISTVVVVGMIYLFFNQGTGLINTIIKAMGGEAVPFLTDAGEFPHLYVWSGIWQHSGWGSIIYIATLTSIDPQLHEAAQIDGAGRLKRIWHINIPGILPTAVVLFVLDAGRIMNVGFEKVFLMQNPQNISTADVISTFVYKVGLQEMDYGFSTAVSLFNNVINVILLLAVNSISKKVTENSLF